MTDESVRAALRSTLSLVVVESPAGCGKTHQGAEYARELATDTDCRFLILTHTHAACSMFAERIGRVGSHLEISTIDSFIMRLATAYHKGLKLPADTATWVRQQKNGHAQLAMKVAELLLSKPMIAASMARRYPVIVCDEHQDSSKEQHSVVMALLEQGAKLRIFCDPVQDIFPRTPVDGGMRLFNWNQLKGRADVVTELNVPHRWSNGCLDLGEWTLKAREIMRGGGKIDLRKGLPQSISVVFAENQARRHGGYSLSSGDRREIDIFVASQSMLLVLTHYNDLARSLRGFFCRRIPLWEGHKRDALEKLLNSVVLVSGDSGKLAAAVVTFMKEVGKGFSPSGFGDRFEKEAREGCIQACRGKPATIQKLARLLVDEPNHHGVANMLRSLWELKSSDDAFSDVEVDGVKEFWEAIRLGGFEKANDGLVEITHRRSYSRPKPPNKAISTIHKAKGLECESCIVMPCDSSTFPEKWDARCLLYVALSRAKNRLMLVVSRENPSPLFEI